MADSKVLSTLASLARWTARVWTILLLLVVAMELVEVATFSARPTLVEAIAFGHVVVAALALLAAWRWEAAGGAVAVAVALELPVFHVLALGPLTSPVFTAVLAFGVPGALYLASWALRRLSPATT